MEWNVAASSNVCLVLWFNLGGGVCVVGGFFLTTVFYRREILDSIISSLSVMNLRSTNLCDGRVVHLLLSEFRILKGVLETAGSVPSPQNLKKSICMYIYGCSRHLLYEYI